GHWGALPDRLAEWGVGANWIQHYLESSVVPSTGVALEWVARFNARAEREGFHTFIDGYISAPIVARAVRRWFRLQRCARRLGGIENAFRPRNRQVWLWPVVRDEWRASMSGPVSVNNLLWLEQCDQALAALPRQVKGAFLCENQSWERALVWAWRKHGHGELIGYSHSTVRFWDLRCYDDPRTLASTDPLASPQPDRFAVNGPAAMEALRAFGPVPSRVVECEALRYDYLRGLRHRTAAPAKDGAIRLLVLGDFDAAATAGMLRLLETAVRLAGVPVRCGMKSHPNFTVNPADYPSLGLVSIEQPIADVLAHWDVAFTSNTSSAAVDALLAGLAVAVMLDDSTLNFSPLRGHASARFVSSPEALRDALLESRPLDAAPGAEEFFHLDPALPRWQRLLGAEAR
ncbi:MAG: TIGR04326 family surface carbohydrate biosynthesis protein, partial [Acidobacteriota bacterium]